MAKGISDISNGNGYIYATASDGTTIQAVFANDANGVRQARLIGAVNAPLSANKAAIATVTITACASTGNITNIDILGVNQLGANVVVTTAVPATEAAKVATAINSFTPASGYNYTATSQGGVVYIFAPPAAGSSVNGQNVTVSVSIGSIVTTTTAFVNGSDIGGDFDQSIGYRFFLDAGYGAAGISGSVTASPTVLTYATEITKYLTVHGMEGGVDVRTATLSGDKITGLARRSAVTYINVDTEGAAGTDNMRYLDPSTFVEGDIVVLRSVSAARVVTVKVSTGVNENFYPFGGVDMALAGNTNAIMFYFSNDAVNGASFYEVTRSGDNTVKPTLAVIRSNGIAEAKSGVADTTLATGGGTINLVPGTDKQFQHLTGSGTLTGSWTVQGSGSPMDGDEFYVKYDGTFTAGANSITIFGNTLSSDEIALGGFMIFAKYDASATAYVTQKFFPPAATILNQYETITVPISFEAGEKCTNRIYVNYKFDLTTMNASTTKLIAATDSATITAAINGTPVTTGVITIPPDTALDTQFSVVPTAAFTGSSSPNYITLTAAKTTSGGKAIVSLILKRKP